MTSFPATVVQMEAKFEFEMKKQNSFGWFSTSFHFTDVSLTQEE